MTDLALASEFPAATRDGWLALVDRVLKGGDFDRRLVARTYDGLRIEPLYPKADASLLASRSTYGPWQVSGRMDHPDPAVANELALADLDGGADALTLSFAGAAYARGFGLPEPSVETLDRALQGVMLDLISVRIEAGPNGAKAARALLDLVRTRGQDPSRLNLDLGLDPVGTAATSGAWDGWETGRAEIAGHLGLLGSAARLVLADGRPYHEAGASEAQELAAVLATGLVYLRALEAAGASLEDARRAISFLLVADADQFLTVAKMRALRRLWAEVETACGLAPEPIRLHAETAWRMLTRRDPWVNLLRGTLAAFAAGVSGADAITVLPFTAALGLPDAFARRLARNTQTILLEESNLWRVADPVAGSGGMEALTDGLAAEAWTRFQEIEREGGIVESLRAGKLSSRIAETRTRRNTDAATRRLPVTGTSEFPDIHETAVSVLMPRPETEKDASALPSIRTAEPYEALRDASDAALATSGHRPRVFLANLGPLAAFSARATFAKNAFEAGGIEAIASDGFANLETLVDAFRDSGTPIACICSSDEIYETQAERAASALKEAGATHLYLAGRPGNLEPALRGAGVIGFVFVGCNLLEILQAAQRGGLEARPGSN